MTQTRVLVVDDSLTMRALITNALEQIPDVKVVGLAEGAAKAKEMVESLDPDVMTLDVEMPGMSGIEYLAEIMETKPMPVIMFSTRTTEGAADSIEALRLGAIDCFPKPRVATSQELDAIITKLGKRIKSAKGMQLTARGTEAATITPIDWNGRLLAIGGDASSTASLFDMFATFPDNCPPTLVVQHLGPGLVANMVEKLAEQVAPKVVLAEDNMAIEQGTIYFAPEGEQHLIVDKWPEGKLRLMARDPIAGERPSISLLFASAAKAAGKESIGVLLMDETEDGGGGIKAIRKNGGYSYSPGEQGTYSFSRGMASQVVAQEDFASNVLKACSK
ncbi:response regulator [Pacificimonas sp. WHA3]|uniref:Response regulator n=1 Tax=Pacificimonas pallii TaxID=2827236 RepID=A0ABS6SFN1_9SPHN|nr:response regulator [Pacificimonas pallii]